MCKLHGLKLRRTKVKLRALVYCHPGNRLAEDYVRAILRISVKSCMRSSAILKRFGEQQIEMVDDPLMRMRSCDI